jgi:hypothetical protein
VAHGDLSDVLPKFRQMAQEAGRDPKSIEITLFRLAEGAQAEGLCLARVVSMFPSQKADTVLPIYRPVDQTHAKVNA